MRIRLLAVLAFPVAVQAQVRDSVLTVSGTRFSRIAADRATFYVLVEGTAETTADAVARVETKLKSVNDVLKGMGNRITVDRSFTYTVGPVVNNGGYQPPGAPPANVARAAVQVHTAQLDQLASIVAMCLSAAASGTSSFVFESTNLDSVRRSKIAEALAAARGDAEALAAALGGKLGALVDASTNMGVNFQQPLQLTFDNRFASQPSASPDLSVNANVTVRYRLIR